MNSQAHNLYVMLIATSQSDDSIRKTLSNYKNSVIKELARLFKIEDNKDLIDLIINKVNHVC